MQGAAVDQQLKINLAALRKCDQFVMDILETSAQVALYKFDALKQEWEKTEVEGSLFLYRRSTLPKFALMIMNRLNRENFNEHITKEMEFKVQKPFLLYKNSSMDILGIWFNNEDKCVKVGEQIRRLYTSPPPPPSPTKVETKETGQSILLLFANAQRKFDEENGFGEPSSLSQPQNIQQTNGEKPRSMSLTVAPRSSPSFLPAVENEDAQSSALHDPCIVKSSPLRRSPGLLSHSLPNSAKKTTQRQLFNTPENPPLPNQFPNEKVPFPSLPSQQNSSSVKATTNKPVVTKQRSSTDLSTGGTPLMSPMAFKSSKSQSNASKEPNVEIPLLTKEQLQESLIGLLERDPDFLDKIHAAYLKNASK